MNLQVPQKVGNFLTGSTVINFSRRATLHGDSYEDYMKYKYSINNN
jgi:hypothetical protein